VIFKASPYLIYCQICCLLELSDQENIIIAAGPTSRYLLENLEDNRVFGLSCHDISDDNLTLVEDGSDYLKEDIVITRRGSLSAEKNVAHVFKMDGPSLRPSQASRLYYPEGPSQGKID